MKTAYCADVIIPWEAKYEKRCDTPKTFFFNPCIYKLTQNPAFISVLKFAHNKKIIIKIITSIFADDSIKICQINTFFHT